MSTKNRFDKRAATSYAADSSTPQNRPSLKQFQADLELEQQRLHPRPQPPATTAAGSTTTTDDLARLSLDDGETGDDSRTLNDLLLNPGESSNASIAAFLARHLEARGGDLILQFDKHSLESKTLASLLDIPDAATISNDPNEIILAKSTRDTVLATLSNVASLISAEVSILHCPFDDEGKRIPVEGTPGTETASSANDPTIAARWTGKTFRILLRRVADGAEDIQEVRVAVVGNVDAGKSSLLGVLTKGRLDDGRGRARTAMFKFKHELESGRTSSVGLEILGFSADCKEVLPENHVGALAEKSSNVELAPSSRKQEQTWQDIASKSAKIVSFTDLAGHEKYLKTTLSGLTSMAPQVVLLIVGANAGLIGMSKEHLSVALALSIPVVVVVTKVDSTPPNVLEQTIKQLVKVLKSPGCRKTPVFVKNAGMACELASNFASAKACPIFLVSNVSGEGLPVLKTFLNVLPAVDGYPVEGDFEFSVSDVFSVPFVGSVVSGVILSGTVAVGDNVLLGPDSLGAFTSTAIKSIQRKRVNVDRAEAGQSVSFALKRIKRTGIRKGMVLLAKTEIPPVATRRFTGEMLILYHQSLLSTSYQAMTHLGSIRQTCSIEAIAERPHLRTGDRATVTFRFIKQSEWIRPGDRFLLREGRCKALGVVTKLLPPTKDA